MSIEGLLDPRVLLVTGKGGVGKSTIAAAIAVAAARTGRQTCLVEVEGRQTMSRLFDTQAWDFTEHQFRPGLFGMSIDPEGSLAEYLQQFYGARRLSKLVVGSTAVEFATAAAPGIKDVLLIGKVKEMERRRDPDGRFHYDTIIVDAPPTGRIVNFLRAPDATTELLNVGPIRDQAQALVDLLLDGGRTRVQLVTLLEEMPVAETLDSAAALRDLGVSMGTVIANRVLPDPFDDAARKAFTQDLSADDIAALLGDAGLNASPEAAAGLRDLGDRRLARLDLQERMRGHLLGRLRLPLFELPYVPGQQFGKAELDRLASLLEEVVG